MNLLPVSLIPSWVVPVTRDISHWQGCERKGVWVDDGLGPAAAPQGPKRVRDTSRVSLGSGSRTITRWTSSVLYSYQAALGSLCLAVSSLIMSLPSTLVQNIQEGRTVSLLYLYSGSPAPHECCLVRKGNKFRLLPIPFLCLLFPPHFAF